MAAMRKGEFAKAWAISDAVLAGRDAAERDNPLLPYHLRWVWDGRNYRGQHVLVRCYHGLGDTVQFARYLPALRPLVASLTVEVQPGLVRLLASVPGPDTLIPFAPDAPLPASVCDIEIMELPHALRLPPESAPPPPYVRVVPAATVPGAVGICCRSGAWDAERDVPEHIMLRLLKQIPGEVFTLQPGPTWLPVCNPRGAPADIADAASLIASLGLVITVDTLFAHLAGALNRPTCLLLRHGADWRWMADRCDTPWYPCMRLYRQPTPGDWDSVVAQIAHDIRGGNLPPGPSHRPGTASVD
jgi:hypothetical protein